MDQKIMQLIELGATHEKKETREGVTRSGWWLDDVFLAPYSTHELALQCILG